MNYVLIQYLLAVLLGIYVSVEQIQQFYEPSPPPPVVQTFDPHGSLADAMAEAEIIYAGQRLYLPLPSLWDGGPGFEYKARCVPHWKFNESAWEWQIERVVIEYRSGINMGSLIHECVHAVDFHILQADSPHSHCTVSPFGRDLCELAPGWSLFEVCGGTIKDVNPCR